MEEGQRLGDRVQGRQRWGCERVRGRKGRPRTAARAPEMAATTAVKNTVTTARSA